MAIDSLKFIDQEVFIKFLRNWFKQEVGKLFLRAIILLIIYVAEKFASTIAADYSTHLKEV